MGTKQITLFLGDDCLNTAKHGSWFAGFGKRYFFGNRCFAVAFSVVCCFTVLYTMQICATFYATCSPVGKGRLDLWCRSVFSPRDLEHRKGFMEMRGGPLFYARQRQTAAPFTGFGGPNFEKWLRSQWRPPGKVFLFSFAFKMTRLCIGKNCAWSKSSGPTWKLYSVKKESIRSLTKV